MNIIAFTRLMLSDDLGNPSTGRVINLIVAAGSTYVLLALIPFAAQMGTAFAFCFFSYLTYGAGTQVFAKWVDALKAKFTNPAQESK